MDANLIGILLADLGFVVITLFSVIIYISKKLSKVEDHEKWIARHDLKSDNLEQRLDKMGIDIATLSTDMGNVKEDVKEIKGILRNRDRE